MHTADENDALTRKRRIKWFFVFGAITLILVVLSVIFEPQFQYLSARHYEGLALWLYSWFALPLIYIVATFFLLSAGSLFAWDLRSLNKSTRRALVVSSSAILIIYFAVSALSLFAGALSYNAFLITYAISKMPALFILPAAALFLGANR